MSIRKKLTMDTLYLSASGNLQKFVSFFVFLIVITQLSVHDYGVLVLLFTLPGPATSLMGLGLWQLITSEIALSYGEGNLGRIKGIIVDYIKLGAGTFCFLIIVGLIFRNYLSAHYDIYLMRYYVYILIFVLGQYLYNFLSTVLHAHEEFLKMSILAVSETIFRLLFFIMAIIFVDLNIELAFLIYAISKICGFLLVFMLSWRMFVNIFKQPLKQEGELKSIIKKTGKWIIVSDMMDQFLTNVNPWLIKIFLNTNAIAIYGMATKVFSTINSSLPINSVLFPFVSKHIKDNYMISVAVQKARKYYLILSVFVIVFIFLFVDYIVVKFIPNYIEATGLIKIFSFMLLVNVFSLGQQAIFFAYRKQKFLFKIYLYGFVQKLLFNLIFLYYAGLIGLVVSEILHLLIIRIYKDYYIRKKIGLLKYKLKDYFVFDRYDRMLINMFLTKFKTLLGRKNS